MTKIETCTKIAWHFLGQPYIWGGDDPVAGFDCSGFCIEILKSVGMLPRSGDWNANMLQGRFIESAMNSESMPEEGYLVFWNSRLDCSRIIHVEYCLDSYLSIGASGGGSDNVTVQAAIKRNAYIKVRPFRSRDNIYGFVDPFAEERNQ